MSSPLNSLAWGRVACRRSVSTWSRTGARWQRCRCSVSPARSPARSPHPACPSPGTGRSTSPASTRVVYLMSWQPMGREWLCPGIGIARGGHPRRVEQFPFPVGWPVTTLNSDDLKTGERKAQRRPASSMRARSSLMRISIWSRIGRTASTPWPAGSSRSQSRYALPGKIGQASPQPMLIT